MKYYIKSKGKTYGPIDETKIESHVISGFFSENSQLSLDLKEWVPLQQCIAIPCQIPVLPNNTALKTPNKTTTSYEKKENSHRSIEKKSNLPPNTSRKKVSIIFTCILLFLLICGGAYFFLAHKGIKDFQEVCNIYQPAVGLVVVTLENSKGELLPEKIGDYRVGHEHPMGTAFAIDKNKFATNSHVAYGLRDPKNIIVEKILKLAFILKAINNGAQTDEEIRGFIANHENEVEHLRGILQANIRVRSVEIRLAHTGGRSLKVSGVQVHPRYQNNAEGEYKNAEFDVAILTTSENTELYFERASKETLYALAPGQEIAYMGFPTEGIGLDDQGDLDLNKPEAIFKSGSINKITDFNNIFSAPELNRSIIHSIPAAGGASGSPIFLNNGEIVAILWGGTVKGRDADGARVSSAVQHNYAVRIDSLDRVENEDIHNIKEWLGEGK